MNTKDRAAIVAQYIVNHRDVEKAIHVGGNIKWIVDAIDEAILAERERCAKIADEFETLNYDAAAKIAREIRVGGALT
jgi:alkyl sulfatase BDS1-like metallo-beta-lactamase superfamily hydrolase